MKFKIDWIDVISTVMTAVCAMLFLNFIEAGPVEKMRENKAVVSNPAVAAQYATIAEYVPEEGDIILTRNAPSHKEREKNPTPGYWNHAAIVSVVENDMAVVEVQKIFPAVVAFKYQDFLARYPQAVVLRPLPKQADANAASAENKFGDLNNYRFAASIRLCIAKTDVRKDNCVSFVRKCYHEATGHDYCWRRPDNIYYNRVHANLTVVAAKCDKNWTEPENIWAGKIEHQGATE